MLGRGIDVLRGTAFDSLGASADREAMQRAMGALHAGKRPSTVAIQIARPDGGSLAAMARFTAVRDFTGVLRAATITLLEMDEGELPDAIEPQRPREAAASDMSYRALFEDIDQGFCVIEVLFEGERPIDYRFIETNREFERDTGLFDVVGKSMRELVPAHESHWYRLLRRCRAHPAAGATLLPAQSLGRWYEVHAFPFGPANSHRVAVLFDDISAPHAHRGRVAATARNASGAWPMPRRRSSGARRPMAR